MNSDHPPGQMYATSTSGSLIGHALTMYDASGVYDALLRGLQEQRPALGLQQHRRLRGHLLLVGKQVLEDHVQAPGDDHVRVRGTRPPPGLIKVNNLVSIESTTGGDDGIEIADEDHRPDHRPDLVLQGLLGPVVVLHAAVEGGREGKDLQDHDRKDHQDRAGHRVKLLRPVVDD
ncbi:hypothetical protein CTA1_10625 [Colletotrichum tanaceti]|uniref:Uncharacterized protein n=1 Tax=Colletotrichum tanaceti TaxID=1306861 RepID=A0A4U6XLL2_9PEZI|nr:hypothetical protein CTA1_10625 [Colletotrichum tanaceti]